MSECLTQVAQHDTHSSLANSTLYKRALNVLT